MHAGTHHCVTDDLQWTKPWLADVWDISYQIFKRCRHQPQCTCERVAGYCVLHAVAQDRSPLYGHRYCWWELQGHPSYYDACDVSCDVIYYVIAVCARRMVRIFFLPYLSNHSKSDPCSHQLFCLESHILSFPKVLQIPPESPCMLIQSNEN